jgi:TusA-related sulfurtransferase
MIELEIENERVEQLDPQQLGEGWILAITERSLGRLEQFCQPDVNSLMLIPKGLVTLGNAVDLVAKFRQWFGACTNFQVEESRVSQIVNRAGGWLGIFYRFRLQDHDAWFVVEQQLYCTLKDGRVEQLHLLCSGFQPVGANDQAALANASESNEQNPVRDGLLVFHSGASETGSTCAVLTPAIKSKLREMQTRQVLEVRVDDSSAREDIETWCRLSGNVLLKVIDDEGAELRFFVKKK